jgi:hypothetical protein
MDAGSAIAALQAWLAWSTGSWVALVVGLLLGLVAGFLTAKLSSRRPKTASRRRTFLHDKLALTPAIVACLLWGAWLGIMAAKFAP